MTNSLALRVCIISVISEQGYYTAGTTLPSPLQCTSVKEAVNILTCFSVYIKSAVQKHK